MIGVLTCALWLAQASTPAIRQAEIQYASSIDPIPNLTAHLAWPEGRKHVPVLVLMHGFREDASSFKPETYERLAAAGAFLVGVEMRGRGTSGGHPDAGGREVYDILDAVRAVLRRYPEETDPDQIHIVGYSGGGANALSCAARFPDTFNSVTSFFGIADYAEWYGEASPVQRRKLEEWVGGPLEQHAAAYASRSPLSGITNYTGGYLRLFQDLADHNVPAVHLQHIVAALKDAGMHNFTARLSQPSDAVRWIHQAPNGNSPDIQAEKEWLSPIVEKRYPAWTVPSAGSLQIPGYLETKLFAIWLDNGADANGAVRYDLAHRHFTIQTAAHWRLTLMRQAPGTVVEVVVNGAHDHAKASADGQAVFSESQ